jgi:hypothetical protein
MIGPYTPITESAWYRWLRQERPEVVEFIASRIITRANCDPRDGRQANQPKPHRTEPGTYGVEHSPRECRNAASVQRLGSEGSAQARGAA